jgi:DNA-binding transcriptional ArsR family regulator
MPTRRSQLLAAALHVHQSTVSRHVATLREAGVVSVGADRRVSVHAGAIRRTCQTLLSAAEE